MDGQEIELKLGVAPEDLMGSALRSCFSPQGCVQPRTRRLSSIYFDTPDFALAAAGVSLRVRDVETGHVQTVKTAGTAASGLFVRPEWEIDLSSPQVDIDHLRSTGLDIFGDDGLIGRLEPIFSTIIEREIYVLGCSGGEEGPEWEIEVALDRGHVAAGGLSEPICEIELELRKGKADRLFTLARRVLDSVAARPLVASKSDRGYRLAAGRINQPLKAKAPYLDPGLNTAEAFQAIARSCLDHLLINEQCLLSTGNGEAIHQMRVALRRLRSAIKVFRPVIDSPQLEEAKADIRWLLNHLGPARDAEVFLAEIIDPVLERHPNNPGLNALRAHWQGDRDTKMSQAIDAVRSRRFAVLVLKLGEWVEVGDWLGPRPRRRLEAPITDFALARMGKSVRKLTESARTSLSRLSPEEQHQVRIRCKQVRYAGEFFASLVPRKHMKVYLAELAELQEVLGNLNDIAVAGPKLSGRHMSGNKAKAAGLVAGWHQARRAALLEEAEKAWKRWRACPLPWDE
ncbi:inorganic triphosphatase [Paramagnetospirillum kuznetsovii]|uniref:Inorganic triphosphatase n=1 Tax=Paramagnetospirillum kuznetsovii TaxID=2053833 RepID=A0A364NWS1_9PROT|nr:CYTH and CHAD domain-containing protein [Paramagnetospirillum kuznetsovii]RAU21541.1 inorganic triphosphatase [Paramagnetospirillum kuznetsovii]